MLKIIVHKYTTLKRVLQLSLLTQKPPMGQEHPEPVILICPLLGVRTLKTVCKT